MTEVVLLLQEDTAREADLTYQSIAQIAALAAAGAHESEQPDLVWQANYTRCTSRTQLGCLQVLRADLSLNPVESGSRLEGLLQRYREIVRMRGYSAATEPGLEPQALPWGLMLQLSGLNLAMSSTSSATAFLSALEWDMRFWRMIYQEGDYILDKMVAVSGLWSGLQFASEFSQRQQLSEEEARLLASILSSVHIDTAEMQSAYKAEFRQFAQLLRPPDSVRLEAAFGLRRWQSSWFLQPGATLNEYYRVVVGPISCLVTLAVGDFLRAVDSTTVDPLCAVKSVRGGIPDPWTIYNPSGNKLLANTRGAVDYIRRVHDVNGVADLVEYQLALQSDSAAAIEEFIGTTRTLVRQDGLIGFPCLDTHSVCQVALVGD